MTIDLHQVDAFTDTIFGGNPAGVVTNADGLSDDVMAKVAREMNLSETAFVLEPTSDEADLRLRYFTPSSEVKFCGHATVGALFELSRLNMFGLGKKGYNKVRVETGAGVLEMSVTLGDDDKPKITFLAPPVNMQEYRLQGERFASEFGVATDSLDSKAKVLIDSNLNYLFIPVKSLNQLGELNFDFNKIRANFAAENTVAFILYAAETFSEDAHLHARVTCPLIGIDEDPFTGSMQSGLVHAAKQNGLIDHDLIKIIVEQGNFMGRPGLAEINHDVTTNSLSVIASATQVFSTTLEVN